MIAYIKGELAEVTENSVVIENNGMGYSVMMPASILSRLPAVGTEIKVHTYLYVKEDILDLYGFLTKDDLHVFKLLLTVNGIGPKGALAILSTITPDDLRFAVLAGDSKTIAKAPGIGSKTAQKLIIELKDKLKVFDTSGADTQAVNGAAEQVSFGNTQKAVEALAVLGYDSREVMPILSKLDSGKSVEDLISAVLREMAAR